MINKVPAWLQGMIVGVVGVTLGSLLAMYYIFEVHK